MSEFLPWLIGFAAFLAAAIASTLVSVRSRARGDGLLKTWAKQGCAATFAMFGVLAAWMVILKLVHLLAG